MRTLLVRVFHQVAGHPANQIRIVEPHELFASVGLAAVSQTFGHALVVFLHRLRDHAGGLIDLSLQVRQLQKQLLSHLFGERPRLGPRAVCILLVQRLPLGVEQVLVFLEHPAQNTHLGELLVIHRDFLRRFVFVGLHLNDLLVHAAKPFVCRID